MCAKSRLCYEIMPGIVDGMTTAAAPARPRLDWRLRFAALSPSNQKRHVLAVSSAKTDETRQRRLAAVLADLQG